MHDLSSGRLCIQAYSPYQRADWKRQWRETKAGDFPGKLSAIVKELKRETATIAQLETQFRRFSLLTRILMRRKIRIETKNGGCHAT